MDSVTVRTLVILRHAKATPYRGDDSDVDRPLTARGRADATAAGHWLAAHDLRPDLVLCSPARRTRETWAAVGAAPP
jgi:phosphohistidine phosphatase